MTNQEQNQQVQTNQATAFSGNFTVHADRKWQGTGVHVNRYDNIDVTYLDGRWKCSPAAGFTDANGNPGFIAKDGYALPGRAEGALIARNGTNGSPYFLGNNGHVSTTEQGELQLIINDDLDQRYGDGFADNEGTITVRIDTRREA